MKFFNGKSGRALIAGFSLLIGTGAVHAFESETDTVQIVAIASEIAIEPAYAIRMSTPEPMGTGRCTEDAINAKLDGGSSQAMFDALVSANNAGRSVTVYYLIDEFDTCNLGYIVVN